MNPNPVPGNASPIDVPLLLDRCMDDAALAIMVLGSFQGKALEDLAEITACVRRADSDAVARRAHALKGSAGAIAASTLMESAARLEEAAYARGVQSFESLLADLSREMHRCVDSMPAVETELRRKT